MDTQIGTRPPNRSSRDSSSLYISQLKLVATNQKLRDAEKYMNNLETLNAITSSRRTSLDALYSKRKILLI